MTALVLALCGLLAAACSGGERQRVVGLVALPEGEPRGALLFFPGDGLAASAFDTLAQGLARDGWRVIAPDSGEASWAPLADGYVSKEECTVLGGFSNGGAAAMRIGLPRKADGVDGVIVIGGLIDEDPDYMLTRINSAAIAAEYDRKVTPLMVQGQARVFPPRSEFLTIRGGNRAGFLDGVAVEGDGEAAISAVEQKEQAVAILSNLMTMFCRDYAETHVDDETPA